MILNARQSPADSLYKIKTDDNRGIRKQISKRRYFQWATLLYESEAKGTFFVLRLFSDSPTEINFEKMSKTVKNSTAKPRNFSL